MALSKMEHLDTQARGCIQQCTQAAQACEWCADACAGIGDEMETCVRLCRDVADLATLHARLLARDSPYKAQLAQICAQACEECAEECARHEHEHCQVCADVLRDCADSCRSLHERR